MAYEPNIQIIVDGDTSRCYHSGDQITGRAILTLEEDECIKGLKLNFVGACSTKTTRPFYITGNDADACKSTREYEEHVCLFDFEDILAPQCTFAANRYSWKFSFIFPESTEGRYSRWAHGPKYLKDPHSLPQTLQLLTDAPGGQVNVSYYIQAKLVLHGSTKRATQMLKYAPRQRSAPLEPKITSQILYDQIWRLGKQSRTAMGKMLSKVSTGSSKHTKDPALSIVPTLHYPQKAAPGQHIPLLLSLTMASNGEQRNCILDSLDVIISTYTTSICGQPMTQPEDTVTKHMTCISKQNLRLPLSLSSPNPLTSNFRLVEDAECVPSFRTYTVTRRYTLTVVVGIKSQDEKFTIHSTTPLEIVPRTAPSERRCTDEYDGIDPLPVYQLRESSKEPAPDYETLFPHSPTPPAIYSLALPESRSSSTAVEAPMPSAIATTLQPELE